MQNPVFQTLASLNLAPETLWILLLCLLAVSGLLIFLWSKQTTKLRLAVNALADEQSKHETESQMLLVQVQELQMQLDGAQKSAMTSDEKNRALELDIARFSERLEQSVSLKSDLQNSEVLRQQATEELAEARTLAAKLKAALEASKEGQQELRVQNQDLLARFETTQKSLAQKSEAYAELTSRRETEQKANAEKLKMLEDARVQLKTEFQALANKIFEEKASVFGQQNKTGIESLLNPLRDQLGDFKKRVEDVYDKEAKDRRALHEQIGYLKDLNQQMSEETLNLTKALKGENKTQGNWGEVILERVLEESGLRRGHEYEVQVSFATEANKRAQPDVVVRLPDQKDIVVDSKVSLVSYEACMSSEDETTRKQALKDHCNSIRNHVKGLSGKEYHALEGLRTLDFVLLFIPIEGAFHLAVEQDPTLFKYAFEQNIVLVSPTTLLVTLRTIHNIWRYEHQSQNARDIAKRGGELHDKFVGFVESMADIGKNLDRTQSAYDTAFKRLSEGRGNLVNQVVMLKKLGASANKSLKPDLLQTAEDSDLG